MSCGLCCCALLVALAAAGVRPAWAQDDPYATARAQFRAAYALAASGRPDAARGDPPSLRAYPLYPYLLAERWRRDLGHADAADPGQLDARAAELLRQYDAQPALRGLRSDWLRWLARRQAWALFLQQYRPSEDTALHCDWLQARIAQPGGADPAPDVTEQWLNGRDTPAECEPAFAWLERRGLLTPALIDQRARSALAAGNAALAQRLAARLPPEKAPAIALWAALIEQPQAAIDELIAQPQREVESAALQDGWQRLARADPDAAAQRFAPLLQARHPDAAGTSQLARALALGLALSRRPQALDYFARVAPADFDLKSAQWNVRAALWAGDWEATARAIAALPAGEQALPRWQYWAARSAEQRGQAEAARQAYARLAAGDGFFAALAAARLAQRLAPHDHPQASDPARAAQLARLPGLVRAHELLRCALRALAAVEWQDALADRDAATRIDAAGLAARWGFWEAAVATAVHAGASQDYRLLYPLPYDAAVRAAAAAAGLPDALVYAMLRQESLYDPQAQSRAGALGLLQLLPDTAARTARRWKLPPPQELTQPAPNLALGAAHLRDLLERFGGQLPLALAAYNAGATAVGRWLPAQPMDADVWIENIPYNETRDYVQRISWHRLVFAWRRSGAPQDTGFLLGQVAPIAAPATDELPP